MIHHAVVHWTTPLTLRYPALILTSTLQACLCHPAPSFPSSSHSPSSPHHALSFPRSGVPPSLNPTHLRSISSALPPSKSPLLPVSPLPPLSLLQVFISLPALQSSREPWERHRALSPWVGDPCQGDKLPTAACLHSWKIKDLWGREGSVCVRVCVIESEISLCVEKKKVQTDWCMNERVLRVCAIFVCVLLCM